MKKVSKPIQKSANLFKPMDKQLKKECKNYVPFDADGWLPESDSYCLNCMKHHKPERLNNKVSVEDRKQNAGHKEEDKIDDIIWKLIRWHNDATTRCLNMIEAKEELTSLLLQQRKADRKEWAKKIVKDNKDTMLGTYDYKGIAEDVIEISY